jgi:leader peptidase (prepilin peptidase) / N-methyltransferase
LSLFYWTVVIIAGSLIGSFTNVVIHRGPSMWGLVDDATPRGSLLAPRSYCPHCRRPIPAWRMVPIVSYLMQRGRCSACSAKISPRYPLVEFAGVLVAGAAYLVFGATLAGLFAAALGWCLVALAVIDWETGFLPDMLTLPLIPLGLAINLGGYFVPIADALIGAAAGYLVFRLIGAAFHKLRGFEGLGQGDAKLAAVIGAWSGWQLLPIAVLAGSVVTLLAILSARAMGKTISAKTEIPFGPGLCAGAFLAVLLVPTAI